MSYNLESKEPYFSGATARSQSVASTQGEDNFAQHFIKNLHRKLRDPSLLQVCPPPPPEFFRHNDKNDAVASTDRASLSSAPREPYQCHPEAWGSPKHPFGAPPGSYKILSSDYAWLDAARQPARRDGVPGGGKPDMGLDGEATPEELPEPPLFMQRTRFLAHGRLVFVKLRQQLEEICVGAVRRIETAASPSALPTDTVSPTLSAMPSFTGSVATAALTNTRSIGATSWGGASFSATSAVGGGPGGLGAGVRGLPPGLVDEIIESVRDKLAVAFEDCLSDTMDQLWGVLQYAGSKHALVDRMSEAMRQRESELEAAFAKYREEAGSRLRSLRRQKEEIEAAAEKDRTELRALAAAASQRVDFLEKDLAVAKAALDKERTQVATKLEAQRAALDAALQAKDDAMEAFRADSAARLEEMRVLNADLQQQLHQRTEEVEKLSVRASDQADMLALALARRDGTFAELEVVSGQLADFKKFITASIRLPLTQWLRTMKEGDVPLTPLIGGPLSMDYGTGRAFVASARNLNLHAVLEELRRVMPKELPWPEEGWPPDGQEESMCDEETATSFSPMSESPPHTRSPSPVGSRDMQPRNPYAPTLPITWHRFVRAPLGDIMSPKDLMVQLAALAKAKWDADKVARCKGLPPPDLHAFVYKRFLAVRRAAVDADEDVVNLVQSLKTHSKNLPRAAIWLQLLQLSSPVLPVDACAYYLELFNALLDNTSRSSPNVVDKATGTVWVSPGRWKTLLTGEFMQVFDTERKAVLLKQTASVRVDTNRGNKTFGLSDLDSLMEVVMGVWLGQRQAAMSELAMSWTAVEPVGGGVLAVNMDVDQLTKIAAHALGPGVLPNNREALLEVYFNTVQAARLSQATARVKWSGFTTAALGTALTVAELLPPRPLTPRGSPAVSRLNAAASLLFQIADPAADEMRSQPAFRLNKAMEALDVSLGRLRRALQACDREELGGPRSEAEEEEAVAAGWAAAEAATAALLAAREAYRGFEANVRDHMIKMAVDAALEKHRGENSDGRRMSNSRHRRASRNFRTSNLSNSGDGGPDGTHPRTSGRHSISGANSGPSLQGRLSARSNGRPSHRPLSGVAPRDLRAVLASAAWSSDGEDLTTGMSMDGGTAPPRLQLRGRSRMHAGPGESVVQSLNGEGSEGNMPSAPPVDTGGVAAGGAASAANIGAGGAGGGGATGIPRNAGGDGGDIAAEIDREGDAGGYGHGAEGDAGGGAAVVAMNAGGVAVTAATAKGDEDDGRVSGHRTVYHELDPDSDIMQRLAELEGKYVRLRSRHDETKRTIHAAYVAAAGSDPSGAGLPSPEVLAEMGPASKLRLVAELLAELHQEVEQGVWPQLDDTVRAAITSMLPRGGGGSRRQSRRSVSLVMPPGMRMTVRPSRLSSLTAVETLAAADTDVDFTTAAPARASSTVLTAAAVVTPLSPSGALGVQGSAVSSVMPAEGVEVEESVYDGVGMAVVDEEGQEGQDGADGGEEPHPAEVAEVAGRLHAHAGHVGQVMAAAAMETAALAAALEDLTSWKSSPSHSASTRWHSGTIGDGLFRNGSSEAAGNGYSSDSAAPPWAGNNLAGAEYGAPGGLLHRSNTLQRVQSVRVPPLPLGALGNWLHDSNNSARDSSRSSRSHSDGSGGGTVRTTSGAAALGEDVHMDPWDAVPVEADPRDTAYLDALRSLHMAAEAQSSTEGDIGVLVKAVQEVVRLLGGQPKITSNGRVIEFFPRRVPTDWRHPVLRSSLSRLYIYVSGALLQQHERAVLLREASADLAQRHAALSRTAEDLSAKAASLRSLEAALGAQLATLASFVSQGSVMVDSLGKLDTASEALQALVAAAQVTEYTPAPPPSPPSPSRVASAKPPVPVQLSRPSSVRGPSMLSRTSFSASASTAPLKGSAAAAPAGAPFAMNELAVATAAAAAAAAAATAVAYAASPAQHLTPAAAERSGSTVAAGDQAPPSPPFGAPSTASMSAALPASAPASILPPLSLGTSSRGPGKPLNKVVIFPQDNWEDMRGIMSIMMGALAQVRSATGRLAAMVRADDGEAQVTSTRAEGSDQALMPKFPVAASRLPSGDHILEVHVHLAGLNSCAAEFTAATSPESQQAGPAAAGTPGSVGSAAVTGANRDTATSCSDPVGGDPPRHQQQQQQRRQGEEVQQQQQLSLNFIVELPLPTARALSTAPHVAVSTSSAAAAATQVPTAQSAMTAAPGGRVDKPAAQAGAAVVEALADGEGDIRSIASDTDGESGTGGQRRGPSAEPTSACLLECPPAATPAVSPEASVTALPAPPGFYLRMALRRAHAVPGSNGGSDGGAGDADLSVLPPGEALVGLSNSMLKRSAMAAVRRHRGAVTAPTGGNGSHGRSTVSAATIATASAAAAAVLGPAPAHYESRPMTARAFVEGVMAQAREEQLQRLYGSAGPMPRGGLPEVEGIARMDEHEASLLMQRVLQLAGPHPEPVTALEALLWEHKEEAEAANAAAASAVADAVSSAAAAAGVAIAQEQQQEQQQRPSSALLGQGPVGPAGAALKRRGGRGLVLVRQQRARSPLRHPVELLDQNRLTVGVTGTRLSTLPPMAALGGGAVGGAGSDRSLSTRSSAHLGYFPGLQVDAGGRVIDWRLPLLVPFAPNQHALHRSVPVERR